MPAPTIFFHNLTLLLERASTPEEYDELLDMWWDARTRASEWDADQWGLQPEMWNNEMLTSNTLNGNTLNGDMVSSDENWTA